MIHSFRDRWLQDFYLADKSSKKIPSEIKDRLFRKLQLISMRQAMNITKRQPVSVGEMINEEFLMPMGLT